MDTPTPSRVKRRNVSVQSSVTADAKPSMEAVETNTSPALPVAPAYNESPTTVGDKVSTEYPIRITLPSDMKLYDFDEVFCRTIRIKDLINIHRAIMADDVTAILDAMDNLISVDIRDLTVPDFKFFQYWQRVNSYPSSPLKYNWVSKYGNNNTLSIGLSDIEESVLEATKEQLDVYLDSGMAAPTARDYEAYNTLDWSAEYGTEADLMKWVFSNAQYLAGDNLQDKINKFRDHEDAEIIFKIKEFSTLLQYGVNEYVTLTDEHYEPTDWAGELTRRINNLHNTMAQSPESFSSNQAAFMVLLGEYKQDLTRAQGGSGPESERIFLQLETDDLFASL